MRRLLLIVFIMVGTLPPLPSAGARDAQQAAAATTRSVALAAAIKDAERITQPRLKEDLYFVASDEMAGRDTPSPGQDATAKFIAERLAKLKVRPAGDGGTYLQHIDLRSTYVDPQKTRAEMNGRAYRLGEHFLTASYESGAAAGPLVYVGHGWVIKSKNMNAYEGLDVRDKIMVVAGNGTSLPKGVTLEEMGAMPAGEWESPLSYAQRNGAKGLVLVPRDFDRAWRRGLRSLGRSSYQVERFIQDELRGEEGEEGAESRLPAIIPSESMLDELFAGERHRGEEILKASARSAPLKGFDLAASKRLSINTLLKTSTARTQNVVGVIEGSDPVLKKEYVAIGAHYDHVGLGGGCRPVGGDSICNGADDDGSGTVAVLAMAEAFTEGRRPKRSILLIWHMGEEKGLWGSEYFTKYPTVPAEQIVAQLNIDMIGRSRPAGDTNPKNRMLTGPDEIYVVGSRVLSTELGELNDRINRSYFNLKYNYHYDAPNDPEQMYTRSDHFNYALRGIPIIFFFDGVHEDYHEPTDSADKIDYRKLERIARTIFVLASEVANAPRRPVVDKELPEERRER